MRYTVRLQPLVTVAVDADDATTAAIYARGRLLGGFRDTQAEVQEIGFLPDYPWSVWDTENTLLAQGRDNDLSPR